MMLHKYTQLSFWKVCVQIAIERKIKSFFVDRLLMNGKHITTIAFW